MTKRIVFVHSLNNFTGSPNVLSQIIPEFIKKGYSIDLITNKSEGFLSHIDQVTYRYTSYKWSNNKLSTYLLFFWSQIEMFFIILFHYRKEKGIFYINTILPFGAVWACKLLNKKRVYHVHENMWLKKPFYWVYRITYKSCLQKSIFVSGYLKEVTGVKSNSIVVYNSVSANFRKNALIQKQRKKTQNNILMIGSLRIFKGIFEFIQLANELPQYNFNLVVSSSEKEVDTFRNDHHIPINLKVYPQQQEMHPFYSNAKILLNLTHPDKWIETFGLTILEGMVYGIPAIAPNVGGPLELIENNNNGFVVDPSNLPSIKKKIIFLMENQEIYSRFSIEAHEKSKQFDHDTMIKTIEKYITE